MAISTPPPLPSVPSIAPREVPAPVITEKSDLDRVRELGQAKSAIARELKKRIVGQDEVIELLLTCVFARGHGLFVGVPGLAKTLLITTLGRTLSLRASRIQFTPDLMPSDITGTDVLDEDPATGQRTFRFVPGPVFTNILLADEINRTPPKTQAALLESMAEGRVSAGGRTYPLEQPYLVFATQNPIEQEGTYPLPEAQLDRFLLQIDVGYPSRADEEEIVLRTTAAPGPEPSPVLDRAQILELAELVPRIPVAPHVIAHAVALTRATRPEEASAPDEVKRYVRFGAGPRASQALVLGAKARAALAGRVAVEVEDVRALVGPVFRHRLVPSFRAEAEGVRPTDIIASVARSVRT
ncbi:MAG TPA: MoxR family ATPase [Polyangiales bacterium]|nr:MoxR family ATPase [Polyangiales bacterium]